MRILQIFGIFVILWQNQFDTLSVVESRGVSLKSDIVIRGCKNLESATPLLRLKKYLFCDYDNTIRSSHYKTATNVTVRLMPKMMEFTEDNGKLILHSWTSFSWIDTHLSWTSSDYAELTYIRVKSNEIWVPDLRVLNSGDMSNDQYEMPVTDCLLFNTGSVVWVPPIKYTFKCDADYTYWPYDKQTCRITLGSWSYTGEELDIHLDGNGICMNGYENNTEWDLNFVDAVKRVPKYECCPNDTYPSIDYTFSLTRHHGMHHRSYVSPAIALLLLTLTVLWLDSRSVERVAVASMNFICHLLCMFDLYWQLPRNGINPPNIMLFYRDSLALATFALILTVLLRKLQDINIEMPNWVSSTTMFILSNRAGRFLVLNDEQSKVADGNVVTEDNSDFPKSGIRIKESSWRHFAAIIEWTSFFCVVLTYIIILIILLPTGVTS